MKINNGDIFNIGQTVNGVSTFCWKDGEWYYHAPHFNGKYEYDQDDLTRLVEMNDFYEIERIGNIFQ